MLCDGVVLQFMLILVDKLQRVMGGSHHVEGFRGKGWLGVLAGFKGFTNCCVEDAREGSFHAYTVSGILKSIMGEIIFIKASGERDPSLNSAILATTKKGSIFISYAL